MNTPISPCLALPDAEPVENQALQPNDDWYCFVDQFGQDTRCPVCEGAGRTRKYKQCPRCRGGGEIQPPRKNTHNSRLDYTTACHQARRLVRRTHTKPGRNSAQFTTTSRDVLRLTIHLPRPYDQPLFCIDTDAQHSQRIADALARTLLHQGHAV